MDDIMKLWLEDNKDGRLSMNHPLNENSIVLDIGSYTGKWSLKMYDKYKCEIHSYEPIQAFHEAHKAVVGNRNIKLYNYGLDVSDGERDIFFQKDGSSFIINNSSNKITVKTKNVSSCFASFEKIDLAKINIEGVEYEIINSLYNLGEISKPNRFMIQFHEIDGYEAKWERCTSQLSETHKKIWGYGTIWELWEKYE